MSQLKKNLTLSSGIPLAIGSIIGSGVLFLPSLTFATAKEDVLLVWIIACMMCVPLLFIFNSMIKDVDSSRGVEGFITLGLGDRFGRFIPYLLLGTVTIGMPASALIVGDFVSSLTGQSALKIITALLILGSAIFSNYQGVKAGDIFQKIVTFLLIIISIAFLFFSFPQESTRLNTLTPNFNLGNISTGLLLTFWAFAGFENLTFIAGEFKNPRRDFLLSVIIALFICSGIYLGLTYNYASQISYNEIENTQGLFQLAGVMSSSNLWKIIVTVFSVFALLTNFNSWVWGISRLIYSSASEKRLPEIFSKLSNETPKNAILLLGFMFLVNTIILSTSSDLLTLGLKVVSLNFVIIYVLSLLSFLIYKKDMIWRGFSFILLIGFFISMKESIHLLWYPAILFVLSQSYSILRSSHA